MIKIDLHVHSSDRSPCGRANDDEQIRAAIAAGLDAIVFTDHHRLVPENRLEMLNHKYAPFRIFGGVEIWCGEDLLVIGSRNPLLEQDGWQYPDLYCLAEREGAFLALAHPFRHRDKIIIDCVKYPPGAVEICSINTPTDAKPRIRQLAQKWGIPTLCNSDAHAPEFLGSHYNFLDGNPADTESLVALLQAGKFRCNNGCGISSN